MYLKNKKKLKLKYKKIKVLIIFLLLIFLFGKLSNNISKYILSYSTEIANKYILEIINNSVNNEILNYNQLYTINKNENNEIEIIDYNAYIVNNILKEINTKITNNINLLENKIIFYVPLGLSLNNVIFNNTGPKIPVKIKLVDQVISNIEIEIKEYGINNCLVKINLKIKIKSKILLPLMSDNFSVNTSIPISYQIITGKIPNYYGNSIIKNSEIV